MTKQPTPIESINVPKTEQKESREHPSYYITIPHYIFEDDRLTHLAQILYGIISSLTTSIGYCYASNGYFAGRFKVHIVTISRTISMLELCDYIKTYIDEDNQRRIYMIHKQPLPPDIKKPPPIGKNANPPLSKNANHNNKDLNNKKENKDLSILLEADLCKEIAAITANSDFKIGEREIFFIYSFFYKKGFIKPLTELKTFLNYYATHHFEIRGQKIKDITALCDRWTQNDPIATTDRLAAYWLQLCKDNNALTLVIPKHIETKKELLLYTNNDKFDAISNIINPIISENENEIRNFYKNPSRIIYVHNSKAF